MKLFVLLALAGLSAADLDLCRTDLGAAEAWLGFQIIGENVQILETAHQNQPQGINFCYGSRDGGASTEVDFYADLTCSFDDTPDLDARNQVPCGGADLGAPYCADNALRALVRAVASSSRTAPEFARLMKNVLGDRTDAIYVARVAGEGVVDAFTYTDKNVCIVIADDADQQSVFVATIAKLGVPSDQGPDRKGARMTKKQAYQSIQNKNYVTPGQKVQEDDPLGAKCVYEFEEYPGFWTTMIAEGVDQAARVGDGYIGENTCQDDRRIPEERIDLAYYVRADLECDDVPHSVKQGKNKIQMRMLNVDFQKEHHEEELEPFECQLDMEASLCPDIPLREFIRNELELSTLDDPYVLAKAVQGMLNQNGDLWNVVATRMHPNFFIVRSVMTDLHMCSVTGYNENDHFMLVQAVKLQFQSH